MRSRVIRAAPLILCLLPGTQLSASPDEEFRRALMARDVDRLEQLIDGTADVNLATNNGKTALMIAAKKGRTDLVQSLLDAGADVNASNHNGGTALMYAAVGGSPETTRLLLSRGAGVNAVSRNGWTAVMIASVKGHETVLHKLLEHGADANIQDVYGWTPLMRAVYENRTQSVETLLAAPTVDVNARNDHGATALHHAAARGYADLVHSLLDHGADLTSMDAEGRTPLMVADHQGHSTVAAAIKDRLERSGDAALLAP